MSYDKYYNIIYKKNKISNNIDSIQLNSLIFYRIVYHFIASKFNQHLFNTEIEDFIILQMIIEITKKQNTFTYSRNRKAFLKKLCALQKQRRDRRIPRASLHSPMSSAWQHLYESSNDQSLITLTGLDHKTFRWLEELFTPVYENYTPWTGIDGRIIPVTKNRGRKRLMDGKDCLGLCLAWTRTRGSNICLQLIFGMTQTPLSLYLRFGRRIIVNVLKRHPYSAVKVPSEDKIKEYIQSIEERHPLLKDVWCTMDGLKLTLQCSGDNTVQNNFYNGWTHDHYVSSVFVFCPDGTIPICCYNVPGSVHDSKIAEWGNIYQKLTNVYETTGAKCTVDSAF